VAGAEGGSVARRGAVMDFFVRNEKAPLLQDDSAYQATRFRSAGNSAKAQRSWLLDYLILNGSIIALQARCGRDVLVMRCSSGHPTIPSVQHATESEKMNRVAEYIGRCRKGAA
jgi:hypothetical protein